MERAQGHSCRLYVDIPEAVLMDILATRLAIEDLVRCTAVCKSWYSLLTSSHFILLHKKQLAATRNNIDLLLVRGSEKYDSYPRDNTEYYSIHLHNNNNNTFSLYKTLDFPFMSWAVNRHFRVVGCFNGVICLSDDRISFINVIILWNPTIRKSVTLPKPLVTFPSHGAYTEHAIGFGFDSATNNYKVVRVVYFNTRRVLYPPVVEVYEVSVGSWRRVDPKGFSNFITGCTPQAFLNGAVHWTGYIDWNAAKNEFMKIIVSFDLTTEVFAVLKMPDSIAPGYLGGSKENVRVSLLGESLALIHCGDSETTSVWVMKQYGVADSWTKVFSIDITSSLLKVCGVLKNKEVLLVVIKQWLNFRPILSLVSYEPNSKQMNHIRDIRNERSAFVDYFVESLALLGVKIESVEPLESENPAASKQSLDAHAKGRENAEEKTNDEEEASAEGGNNEEDGGVVNADVTCL